MRARQRLGAAQVDGMDLFHLLGQTHSVRNVGHHNHQPVFVRLSTVDGLNGILNVLDHQLYAIWFSKLQCGLSQFVLYHIVVGYQNTVRIQRRHPGKHHLAMQQSVIYPQQFNHV